MTIGRILEMFVGEAVESSVRASQKRIQLKEFSRIATHPITMLGGLPNHWLDWLRFPDGRPAVAFRQRMPDQRAGPFG